MTATRVIVAFIVALFVAVLAILAVAESDVSYIVAAVAAVGLSGIALRLAGLLQSRNDLYRSLSWTYVAYAATFTLAGLAIFPEVDRWQNLPGLAQQIRDDARSGPLALWEPDETTIAMIDYRSRIHFNVLQTGDADARKTVSNWFHSQGPQSHILVKLPGRGVGSLTRLVARFRSVPDAGDGMAAVLAGEGVASIERRYELPEGRRYALLRPPP